MVSPVMIIRESQSQETTNILAKSSIDRKFIETGSVGDRTHTGRSSTNKSLLHIFLKIIDKITFKC